MSTSLTTGSPWRVILLFSAPLLVGNVVQQLYQVVDAVVVGRYLGIGSLAVALGPTPDFVERALALPDADAEPEETGPPGIGEAIGDGISAARRGGHQED